MDSISSFIDSAIEKLNGHSNFGSRSMRKKLKSGLEFLKTFGICITHLCKVDEDVPQNLRDLKIRIEDEFGEVGSYLADAEEGGKQSVNRVYSELVETIELLKEDIGEAYEYLVEYPSDQSRSLINDFEVWRQIVYCVFSNQRDLVHSQNLNATMKRKFEALHETLRSLSCFLVSISTSLESLTLPDLWAYLGIIAVRSSRLSYLCWINNMDERDLLNLLSDLQQKIMPFTPDVIDIYFELLKAVKLHGIYSDRHIIEGFVEFLLPKKNPVESLCEGLIFLIKFLISTQEEYRHDVEKISVDIKAVVREAGSLNFVSSRRQHDISLFQLLKKIEILKVEAVLVQLISISVKEKVPAKAMSETLCKGVIYLQSCLRDTPSKITEKGNLILTHIRAVAEGAGSIYESFQASQVTVDILREATKLLVNVKLLKAEVVWMELNRNPDIRDQIETLQKSLEFLRKFVTCPCDGNSVANILRLTEIEELGSQATDLYYSFAANQITEDHLKEMRNLLEKLYLVQMEANALYLQGKNSSRFRFPKIDGCGFIDSFLKTLRNKLKCNTDSIAFLKYQVEVVLEDLEFLGRFLRFATDLCNKNQEVRDTCSATIALAYEADYVIDSIEVRNGAAWYHLLHLSDIIEEFKIIKARVKVINEEKLASGVPSASLTMDHRDLSLQPITPSSNEVMVDVNDQAASIIDQLKGGSSQLEIVSIVGMPGIGKTTLAKKVYNNSEVKCHFHVRAWFSLSLTYQKREMLVKTLGDIGHVVKEIQEKSEEELEHLMRNYLQGKKYFIVMDDICDIKAWHDLRGMFPNNDKKSKILFTSCYNKVAEEAGIHVHRICPLYVDDSWRLLKGILFHGEECPEVLLEVGRSIAEGCDGLPLAICTIAGFLGIDKSQESWRNIVEQLKSIIITDQESRCRAILEMSYNHLPEVLKSCFLYAGAFLNQKEISAKKLKWLWIAEGFITEQKNVEEFAEICLTNLIHRNLLMVAEKRSNGGVKSCTIHGVLRNFCQLKASEENFFQPITGYTDQFPAASDVLDYGVYSTFHTLPNPITHNHHRISICSKRNHFVMLKPSGPCVRTLLFFAARDSNPSCPYDVLFLPSNFKLLRVLDLETISIENFFPSGIHLLLQLKYLAVSGPIDSIPSSIAQLRNLETFSVRGLKGEVKLPDAIWSMESLRHLHVDNSASLQPHDLMNKTSQSHLLTFSSPYLLHGEGTMNILRKLSDLRKLGCIFSAQRDNHEKGHSFPALSILTRLESLKILWSAGVCKSFEFNLPENLKKLTLSNFRLPWDRISTIGKLPNLEVLKLLHGAFYGDVWNMNDEEFGKLKFLKLDSLDLVEWNASEDHLGNLEHLILLRCNRLVKLPSGLSWDVKKLKMIRLQWCNSSLHDPVREIEENQKDLSNKDLEVLII